MLSVMALCKLPAAASAPGWFAIFTTNGKMMEFRDVASSSKLRNCQRLVSVLLVQTV